ncbi:MAG: 4-hydroxybenzoate 3-monooxygenase [Micropruina sp.]|uniref:4-hydroxybenzoate 3-monooxygenase n=1 Tax=Micropruina sp. TaxID=2737536 RepID=UPI0039E42F0F
MNPIQTDVAIVGAGPAGLVLARMLHLQGIDAVVLERRSRDYVLGRVRAGIIEQPVADLLVELGVGERMLADRLVHDGVQLQHRAGGAMVRHRVDFAALCGKTVTVYGQRELVRDLIGLREADGLPLRFGCEVTGLQGLDDDRVMVSCRDAAGESTISARYVAGVDGAHGITAQLLDADGRQTLQRRYPAAWLGVLVEAAPPSHELIYSRHPEGFALASMRTPEVSRLYLQVPAGDTLADWSTDRIWEQLHRRLDLPDSPVNEGRFLESSITPLRSVVHRRMRYGRLLLGGDAAHVVPPSGAKGLNLAVADMVQLSSRLVRAVLHGDDSALNDYQEACLRRVWQVTHFSWWMTDLLHRLDDEEFGEELRSEQIRTLSDGGTLARWFADSYTGLPI